MGKVTLLAGLAAGYVLGTRDGRERYEQIKTQATKVLQDPRVKRKAAQAQDLAKEKAPLVQDKVSQATHRATPSTSTPSTSTPSTSTPGSASDVAGDAAAGLGADTGADTGTVAGSTTAPGATDPLGGRDV